MIEMRIKNSVGMLAFGVLACLCLMARVQYAGAEPAIEPSASRQIPIVGFVEYQEFEDIAAQIGKEYLSHQFTPTEDRNLAIAIDIYIGPGLFSNGRFVPPDGYYLSPDQLEILGNKTFPNDGCKIERLWFKPTGEYVVLLTDGSDQPPREYIEKCLLGATLVALGEQLDGTPVESPDVLRKRILKIVGELL